MSDDGSDISDDDEDIDHSSSYAHYYKLKRRLEKEADEKSLSSQLDKVAIGRIHDQAQLALRPRAFHHDHKKKEKKSKSLIYARVWAKEARNLVATDINLLDGYAASDPLLQIQIGNGEETETRHIIKNLNPKWDQRICCTCEEILWNTDITTMNFTLTVLDKDLLSEDDPIGYIQWNILDMIKNKEPVDENKRFLRVTVHRCLNITAGDADGYSDSYVKLQFAGKEQATRVVPRTLYPEYDEEDFWFPIPSDEEIYASFEKDWAEMEMTPAILRAPPGTEKRVKMVMKDSFELLCEAFRVYSMLFDMEDEDELDEDFAADIKCARPSWDQSEEDAEETISFKEFVAFCRDTSILDKKAGISKRTIKEIFRRVNTETEEAGDGGGDGQFRTQGDTQLERPEFFECLLYLAGLRFRTFPNPATQLELLLDDLIEPALAKPNDQGIIRVQLTAPDLRVSVWDCDAVGDDDFLGETYISLGEAARRDITKKSAIQYGRRWELKKRPGRMNRFERVSGSVYITSVIVNGDEDEYGDGFKNEGHHRFEFDDWFPLEYHPEMEGEVEPEEMSGDVRITGTILVPKEIVAKEQARLESATAVDEEKENDMSFIVHAVDEWSSKSFKLNIGGTDPDFKWIATVVSQRYERFLKPNGRVRVRETGQQSVRHGKMTPFNLFTQLPAGTDKLGAPPHPLMSKVNGNTKLRDILQNNDNIWVQFQNTKPKNVIAGLTQLQKEQKAVDANRRWLKRLCREEEVKIQVQIAQRFKRLQEEDGKTIVQIFEDFDDDGGGTIDHDELREGFAAIEIELSEEQFQQMLTIWDESGDGEIDYEEFADMFERIQKMLDEDHRRPLVHFDVFENTGEIRRKPEFGKKIKKKRKSKEEQQFELDLSVFNERIMESDAASFYETEDVVRKALLMDLKHAHRLQHLFDKSDFARMQVMLTDHYHLIVNIFKEYCCDHKQHGYFMMSWNSFSKFCENTNIIDKRNCRIRDIDQIFVKVNVQTRGVDQNHMKALSRFEFIEAVVRLANRRYRTLGNGPDALNNLIMKNLHPNYKEEWDNEKFRREILYKEEIHKVFHSRMNAIKKLYKETAGSEGIQEDYVELVTLKEFIQLMKKVNIVKKGGFTMKSAICAFVQAQMLTFDEQTRDKNDKRIDSHDHMTLVEFLESLVRIAIKHPECTSENPPEKLKELLALLFEDEKRTKSKVANMFGGGGGKKKGGGFAGMFGMKKKK